MDATSKYVVGGLLLLANRIIARLDDLKKQHDAYHKEAMSKMDTLARSIDSPKESV